MILDTNALSAFLLADRALLKVFSAHVVLRLPVIVLGEYRFGLLGSRDRQKLGSLLDGMESVAEILPVDGMTVKPYTEIREELRRSGTRLPQNDTWIAALARQHDLPIISRDNHFDYVSGIRRLKW